MKVKLSVILSIMLFLVILNFYHRSTEPLSYPLSQFEGKWEFSCYIGTAIQSHIEPLEKGYNPSENEIKAHSDKYLSLQFDINKGKIQKIEPPCELGYYYNNARELFFGYKVPNSLQLNGRILYIIMLHSDFDEPLRLIADTESNIYVDISGYFYELNKIE